MTKETTERDENLIVHKVTWATYGPVLCGKRAIYYPEEDFSFDDSAVTCPYCKDKIKQHREENQ